MWTNEHYGQIPKYTVSGLILNLLTWRFSYGAEYESEPNFVAVNLHPMAIAFAQGAFEKRARLYIVPASESPDNYYLSEWSTDPAQFETENPPIAQWTDEVACIPCLEIVIPASGGGNTIVVKPKEFALPDPPDQRREIKTKAGQVKAWRKGKQPEGWELLDAKKHKKVFPISLGRLKPGENWYILTPEAEEKLKHEKSSS